MGKKSQRDQELLEIMGRSLSVSLWLAMLSLG